MINNLFTTPVYFNQIDEKIHSKLKKDVKAYIKKNSDLFKTDKWKCNTETNIFCDDDRRFFPDYLEDLIAENTSRYIIESDFVQKDFVIEDCWLTVGGEGAYQELHDHLDAGNSTNGFSGVLYISANEESGGEFVMQSPIDTLAKLLPESKNGLLAPQVQVKPKEGLMVSFPSWLKHGSYQYTDKKIKRISISWNIDFIED